MPFDLATCFIDVVRGHRDVAGIDYLHRRQRRHPEFDMVTGPQRARSLSDRHWPEPRAGAIGRPAVERHSQDCDVIVADLVDVYNPRESALTRVARDCRRRDGAERRTVVSQWNPISDG